MAALLLLLFACVALHVAGNAVNIIPFPTPCRYECLIACVCPPGEEADPTAIRPPTACCWCPPCIPKPTPPPIHCQCDMMCACLAGEEPDPNAVRPPVSCCWCPPCIPKMTTPSACTPTIPTGH
ncbi:hypothetical protein QR680_013844 [Steinernema hermaphroditum]|uniref:Uncharacterized protein n=1 Tax=Steinernema hermaphroditum TaxID=289476 RepID=A0AA39M2X8_9BILA|nr:hypothetical protein QR680_013844 [Steinernema hermaphroditum]